MARLSWNEISARAARFAEDWSDETYERGEAQSFWTQFLEVFGIDRRRAGGFFEYGVKLAGQRYGFIDMFLPGKMIVEHKSAGRDLIRATSQALGYLDGIPDHDLPDAIVACDFRRFELYDTSTREVTAFDLADLPKHVRLFGFLIEERSLRLEEQSPVNREAAERMAALHNKLRDAGFVGHKLELFLVRIVFCHFADDSGIFEPGQFEHYLRNRTSLDGTDVGPRLARLFDVLNTPKGRRPDALDDDLRAFKYINGGLFDGETTMPDFDESTRMLLIQTCAPDWSKVSPAIFGSMFQGVMDDDARHDVGAHYTSEENILRVIKPLFLDDLFAEFDEVKSNAKKLRAFHEKIANLGFLDPACGCGNFLVIAYRELRRLEHRILRAQMGTAVALTDVADLLKVSVEQFAGIEVLEFPAMIARTAMWLTDHQMNLEASNQFGTHYARIPLSDGAAIANANALTMDWNDVRPAEDVDFVLGNPPFLGSRVMDKGQKAELRTVAQGLRQAGFLDFVVAWYLLADRYLERNPEIQCALVSTNSISQGEQPGIFWPRLFDHGTHINFAHRTFVWTNDARGVAAVHCVIIGFARRERATKQLFDYVDGRGEPTMQLVESISPYLLPGDEFVVANRETQISGMPKMAFGNMPADGGNLLLSPTERGELIAAEPAAAQWILPFLGAEEFLNSRERYCLWLEGASASQLRAMPLVYERVKANRETRAASSRPQLADIPHLFAQITQRPDKPFLLVPSVSSERRPYVPMGFVGPGVVASNLCLTIEGASLYEFGILTSELHMDWLRTVGGRLESRYRYSKDVVYNNFVFPEVDDAQRAHAERLARTVLDAREQFPGQSLADLYDDVAMPAALRTAHRALDRFVDGLYQSRPFASAAERVDLLLRLNRDREVALRA